MNQVEEIETTSKGLDYWLDTVSYSNLESPNYVPSEFALSFVNFIKLANDGQGESSPTPLFHFKMLDDLIDPSDLAQYVCNLCFRGASKTSLMVEYLALYLGVFGELPNLGSITGMLYVTDSMENGVKSARKNIEFRYNNSDFLRNWIPKASFTDNYIEFTNKVGKKFGMRLYGAETGIRGGKIFGKRPQLAVLDDLLSDKDARSPTVINSVKDTIYRGVNHALDPNKRKVVMNGTPFNESDPMIEAIKSGTWKVNVYPVCEVFPCSREEFRGAWVERFDYDYINRQYDLAMSVNDPSAFYQELMLRITAGVTRIVDDVDIRWYKRDSILDNLDRFNVYFTSDIAVTDSATSDDAVILVWALSSNGDWFLLDGHAGTGTMDIFMKKLFRFAHEYRPIGLGIERAGQQGGFIPWIKDMMITRNTWFEIVKSHNSTQEGIKPVKGKLTRFSMVAPMFKSGKIHFPIEWKKSTLMTKILTQISLVTTKGIRGKDDLVDAISMLAAMDVWKPSESPKLDDSDLDFISNPYGEVKATTPSNYSSYIV
jgi:phage terminase large subunit-like protein